MSLRDEMQKIYEARGQLTPATVLDAARRKKHPLHNRFEWDDTVAGEKYRLVQAHELIRSVRIVYRDEGDQRHEVRAFHAIRREHGHVYEPLEEIAADEVATAIVLAEAERAWRDLRARYAGIAGFIEIIRRDLDEDAA